MKSPKDKIFESQDNGAAGQGMSSEALEYLKKAQQGDPEAQFNLGWCYANGKGVKQDWQKAIEWFTKAAEQGSAVAQRNLGWCYEDGKGVKQDYKKAVEWYTKAAQQGDEYAKEALKRLR